MSSKGQTINDRLNAAKYTIAGRSLPRCVCKATTEELIKPKRKHLEYLVACTHESDISMSQLANLLIERTYHNNWVVVYKALVTVHHLMSNGSEKFIQYLASSNHSFILDGSIDKIASKGFAMSTFIRRYSLYINQKALSYRGLAVDLCRKPRGRANILREMPIETLLKTLPVAQKQLDVLLDFGCTASDLNNSIIVACFTLLFHDAIRLFASYNDGIINLFEKYFDLNKKMCREAFEAYKKFLNSTDRVVEFLKIAQTVGLDTGSLPDFKRAPSSLLDALEQHLLSLESNKKRDKVSMVIDTSAVTVPSFSTSLEFEPSMLTSDETIGAGDTDPTSPKLLPAETAVPKSLVLPPAIAQSPTRRRVNLGSDQKGSESRPNSNLEELRENLSFNPESFDGNTSLETTNGNNNNSNSSSGSISSSSNNNINNNNSNDNTNGKRNKTSSDAPDMRPPGYSDGTLLMPEFTLQTQFDPSIDLITQQQLIQIQRERASLKYNQSRTSGEAGLLSGSNNSAKDNNSLSKGKKKHESIFEDLEQTMRQSLKKVEKA